MRQIPPFYVGEKVVCIKTHSWGFAEKGKEYIITVVHHDGCHWLVGIGLSVDYGGVICSVCGKEHSFNYGEQLVSAKLFNSINSDFNAISYERVMELESHLINSN